MENIIPDKLQEKDFRQRKLPEIHDSLLTQVVQKFTPTYTPDGNFLYLGDIDEKIVTYDVGGLASLGVAIESHEEMPNIVIHYPKRNWLVLLEVITLHKPIDDERKIALQRLFKDSKSDLIFVTAFLNRVDLAKHFQKLAWGTEIWMTDQPKHLIHLGGDQLLGPYES